MTIEIEAKEHVRLYRLMWAMRLHEEAIKALYTAGKVGGTTHLYIGQEAIAAGVIGQLRAEDYISSTHRGHGHMLAKGGELKPMLAEILGKATGYCKGKGGSMHIASLTLGNLGANGIVSGGLPIAVGAALASHMKKDGRITVVSFGDGATGEGNTHESMNLAAIWKLPVLFLFENNQYAVSTRSEYSIAGGTLLRRAEGYGMAAVEVDGNDLEAVYNAAREAIAQVRAGGGPFLLQANSYRIEGHYYGDAMVYRSKEETEAWRRKDPIHRTGALLVQRGILSEAGCQEIRAEVQRQVDEAVAYAEASPEPTLEALFEDVYTEGAL